MSHTSDFASVYGDDWDWDSFDEDDFEYKRASIPPIPPPDWDWDSFDEDTGGRENPHLATLSTAEGLDDVVWAALPDALVDCILIRLPPAAFARLRSVCKRWNELPSSSGWLRQYAEVAHRPSCTVMKRFEKATVHVRTASFYCHSERNWFDMPPLGRFQGDPPFTWELADIDWGLIRYACYRGSGLWLCVNNPLTKAKTVLPPPLTVPWYEFMKLVVDRQSKTYKIVVLLYSNQIWSTMVYDSATAVWTVLQNHPLVKNRAKDCILWKRTIFMPCVHRGVLLALDVDIGKWKEVEIELPNELWVRYFFVSRFDWFMIIRSYDGPHDLTTPMSVLWLKDDAASPFPLCKSNGWVEMDVHNRAYLELVVSVARCNTSHKDCLIFTDPLTNQWITYTFRTRTWRDMPSRSEKDAEYAWYDSEPRWDVGTGPDPSPILNTVA